MLPAAYAGAVKDAKAGQVVGPFDTAAGWVIARVDDVQPAAPLALDIARPQIIRFLTYDQVKDLVLDLRKHAKVEMLLAPAPTAPGGSAEPASAPAVPIQKAKP
jgi:peptidyl-prolyl cis-trans isomerase C